MRAAAADPGRRFIALSGFHLLIERMRARSTVRTCGLPDL
jgi:hypothetical protein